MGRLRAGQGLSCRGVSWVPLAVYGAQNVGGKVAAEEVAAGAVALSHRVSVGRGALHR